ncbi:MAG: element excision factor XisH family protein, partial [Blastocatellia bacterium]
MSRRDTYHDVVKRALVKDGWTISHDPLRITYRGMTVSTDLGAEKVTTDDGQSIAVEIIAVEVKDFDGQSVISEFEKALGQYRLY